MTSVPAAPEPGAWSGALGSLRLVPVVLGDAARLYGRHALLIVPVAVAVFGATDLGLHAANDWLNHPVESAGAGNAALAVAVAVAVLLSSVFAELFFAGLLDRVVEAALAGRPLPALGAVVAGLPYVRLLLADALVVGLGIVGLALLVLPGLAVFTLLGLTGPLVIVERRGAWRAARRSFELLRGRLGAAVLLVLVPLLVTSSVDDWLAAMAERWPAAVVVAFEVGADATLAAYAGLLLAVLARRLSAAGSDARPG